MAALTNIDSATGMLSPAGAAAQGSLAGTGANDDGLEHARRLLAAHLREGSARPHCVSAHGRRMPAGGASTKGWVEASRMQARGALLSPLQQPQGRSANSHCLFADLKFLSKFGDVRVIELYRIQ